MNTVPGYLWYRWNNARSMLRRKLSPLRRIHHDLHQLRHPAALLFPEDGMPEEVEAVRGKMLDRACGRISEQGCR